MAEVVIIGAGLTGLSAAYHLEKSGFFDYTIFEREDRPGGLLKSVNKHGFTFDQTGHWLHISNLDFKLFLDTVAELKNFSLIERKAGIFSHNVITEYPFQGNLFGLPSYVIAECIQGYVARHTHIKKPINFYQWVLKYFGRGMGKHFFFPYNKKLLAYDLKKVHHSWTGRFVPQTSLETIINGAIANQTAKNVGYNSCFYYPNNGGIEFIIKQLIAKLVNPIKNLHTVTHIDTVQKIIFFQNGTKERYQHLITTMPLNQLLTHIKTNSRTTVKNAAGKLLCNGVININFGFKTSLPIDKHWLYFPESNVPWYRIGFWNNISPSLTPAGRSSIYSEISYIPNKTSTTLLAQKTAAAQETLLSFFGLTKTAIATQHTFTIKHAYVIYDLWREKNISQLLERLELDNIYSIGRYGAWKYSSMQEAFLDGKNSASKLMSIIKSHQTKILPALHVKQKSNPKQRKKNYEKSF